MLRPSSIYQTVRCWPDLSAATCIQQKIYSAAFSFVWSLFLTAKGSPCGICQRYYFCSCDDWLRRIWVRPYYLCIFLKMLGWLDSVSFLFVSSRKAVSHLACPFHAGILSYHWCFHRCSYWLVESCVKNKSSRRFGLSSAAHLQEEILTFLTQSSPSIALLGWLDSVSFLFVSSRKAVSHLACPFHAGILSYHWFFHRCSYWLVESYVKNKSSRRFGLSSAAHLQEEILTFLLEKPYLI